MIKIAVLINIFFSFFIMKIVFCLSNRFGELTTNGKSIGEVRTFEELKVQERPNVECFFNTSNLQKFAELKA